MKDYYEGYDYDEPQGNIYDDEEFPFSAGERSGWDLCGNCHNYKYGVCMLDGHEVYFDDGCTYNLKKGLKED